MEYSNESRLTDVSTVYKVYITAEGRGKVVGFLPQAWGESTASSWAAPLSQLLSSLRQTKQIAVEVSDLAKKLPLIGDMVGSFGNFLDDGVRGVMMRRQTANIWTGCSPITINGLKIVFVARTSAYDDVVIPSRFVQGLSLPTNGESADAFLKEPPVVSIRIGKILYIREACVHGVSIDWTTKQVDSSGYPLRSEVSLSIQSKYAYVLPDEDAYVDPAKAETGAGS